MKIVELEGVKYKKFEWQKPEDTDYAVGEICLGIYAAAFGDGPYTIVALPNKRFVPYELKSRVAECVQPLYVLPLPQVGSTGYIEAMPYETD